MFKLYKQPTVEKILDITLDSYFSLLTLNVILDIRTQSYEPFSLNNTEVKTVCHTHLAHFRYHNKINPDPAMMQVIIMTNLISNNEKPSRNNETFLKQ